MTQTVNWESWMGIQIKLTQSGMNQGQFAHSVGWDPSKVSRTLKGKRRVTEQDLRDVVRVLGGDYEWYIDGPYNDGPSTTGPIPRYIKPATANPFAPVFTLPEEQAA